MITLDIDLSYLTKHFEINTQRVNSYGAKSLEEVMELEAMSGNKKAEDFSDIYNDPEKLAKLFKLTDATNRFLIIKNLNEDDLKELLQYLSSEDLVWGLQYFNVDKLVDLLEELPQEELLALVLDKFALEDIVALMQTDEMNEFLTGTELERGDVMKFFESLDFEKFKQLMMQVMGPEVFEQDRETTMAKIENMDDKEFKRMMTKFENQGKKAIVFGLLYNKPEYLEQLKNETLARPFAFLEKGEILKSMKQLDPEFLIPMVEELPKDLIQVVATQIDPGDFAEILSRDFKDILSQIKF